MAKKNKKNSNVFGQGQKEANLSNEQALLFGVQYYREVECKLDGRRLFVNTPISVMPESDFDALKSIMTADDINVDDGFIQLFMNTNQFFIDNMVSFFTRCVKRNTISNSKKMSWITYALLYLLIPYFKDQGQDFFTSFINTFNDRKEAIQKENPTDNNISIGIVFFDGIVRQIQEAISVKSNNLCS